MRKPIPLIRCTYSPHGIESLYPYQPNRLGWVKFGTHYAKVKWDGNFGFTSYHKDFILTIPMPRNRALVPINDR
jgi:hypothetical protein